MAAFQGTPPYEAGFYRNLLVNSPYMDFLKAHVQEICQIFPVDGFFFDIVGPLNDSVGLGQARNADPRFGSRR